MNHILNVFKKYAVFNGRSQRAEYWYFVLFYYIFAFLFLLLTLLFIEYEKIISYIRIIVMLPMFVPLIAVTVRRLHDVGKSGWMIFINFIPIVGAIWFIVLMATDSDAGDNEYGPNPKILKPQIETASSEVIQ